MQSSDIVYIDIVIYQYMNPILEPVFSIYMFF